MLKLKILEFSCFAILLKSIFFTVFENSIKNGERPVALSSFLYYNQYYHSKPRDERFKTLGNLLRGWCQFYRFPAIKCP